MPHLSPTQDPHVLPLLRCRLADSEDTTALGRRLAPMVAPGDTLLLQGPIGAGKSHLARSIIQSRLAAENRSEDVPSPTFTLIQTYETAEAEILHADLYRLSDPDELFELGLDGAFETAICLIEWPDRLGSDAPPDALTIDLTADGDGRIATLSGPARWAARLPDDLPGRCA